MNKEIVTHVRELLTSLRGQYTRSDVNNIHQIISTAVSEGLYRPDKHGIEPVLRSLRTATLVQRLVAPDRNMTIAVMLYNLCRRGMLNEGKITQLFGGDVTRLVHGLVKVAELYKKQAAVADDNFHKLVLVFASDIRVVIIMIIDRLALMRHLSAADNAKFVHDIASESRYLYAPLAHKLGLYMVKSELEDLSLRFLRPDDYAEIASKLEATKRERENYIEDFIAPIRKALDKSDIKNYTIKGRTKSINSVWNKMTKKKVDMSGMYDIFAIRIIIDTPAESEKRLCWTAYSLVTDIYTPNTSRLRDWISLPKSNGYESLHITVKGSDDRWVEVQIRSKRMDEVAEKGVAAHWNYKGVQQEVQLDKWINNVREILEAGEKGPMDLIRNMHVNLYEQEIFVFTPGGDLFQLPQGATVLDFAYRIHTDLGAHCAGAIINGKNQKINYKLQSGDTVSIVKSATQQPRLDWLNYVVTSKARNKIRQAANEERTKKANIARETLSRRFKNRKIDADDATMSRLIKKKGYKNALDFFEELHDGKIDPGTVVDEYVEFTQRAAEAAAAKTVHETAENFKLEVHDDTAESTQQGPNADILVIGDDVKGINYRLAKCCNPIFGDKIMGFVSSDGVIKIHRTDCKNAQHLASRYPYRTIRSRWSGKLGAQFGATLKVVGRDDIGIVTNISSLINKEGDTILRSISISSNGGLFEGYLVIGVSSTAKLEALIKKIKNLKGVKDVQRSS